MPQPSAHSTCAEHPDTAQCTEQCSTYAESDDNTVDFGYDVNHESGMWVVKCDLEGPEEEMVTVMYGHDPHCAPYGWATIEIHRSGRTGNTPVVIIDRDTFELIYHEALLKAKVDHNIPFLRRVLIRLWKKIVQGQPVRLPVWVGKPQSDAVVARLSGSQMQVEDGA